MFIYEIKNILADGKPVNGMIIQSTVGTSELIPAKDGDSCGLIYVSKEDDKPIVNYLAEYEMQRNDTEEKPEDVKLLAYQGKLEREGKVLEGLIFRPILDTNYTTEFEDGDSFLIIAEKEDGEYLEAPEIICEEFAATTEQPEGTDIQP